MSYKISRKDYEKVYAIRMSDGSWSTKYDSNKLYLNKSSATKRANIINQSARNGIMAEVVESKLEWILSNS